MRITSRISAGASRSLTRIPLPQASIDACLGDDGKLDLAKARAAFVGGESEPGYLPFMGEASDDLNVYFAVLTFMDLFHDAYAAVIDNPNADCADHAVQREDARIVAKMEDGKYCIVRMDVRRKAATVGVRVSVGNPHEVVGKAWIEAKLYAATCVQLWLRMAQQITWLTVTADEDILADAHAKNAEAEDRRAYGTCERRHGCLCSPCRFDCKFYSNGNCTYGETT